MPPGGSYAWIGAYVAQSQGRAGVYLTFGKAFDRARDFYDALLAERDDIERSIGVKLDWTFSGDKAWISAPTVKFTVFDDLAEQQRVARELADMSNRFVNAFRFRLEALSRDAA